MKYYYLYINRMSVVAHIYMYGNMCKMHDALKKKEKKKHALKVLERTAEKKNSLERDKKDRKREK